MTKREELKRKYKKLGWELPARMERLSEDAIAKYVARADAELFKRKNPEEDDLYSAPPVKPAPVPEVDIDLDDGLSDCEDEIRTKQVLPDLVEECAEHLKTALRLYIKRRMWLSTSDHRNDPEVVEYLAQAKKAVARAVCCIVTQEGNGYERGSRMMQLFDTAITEMRNEFTDALVATAVMNTLLSDKHQVEMAMTMRNK